MLCSLSNCFEELRSCDKRPVIQQNQVHSEQLSSQNTSAESLSVGIDKLPSEVLRKVFMHLGTHDVACLACTSQSLRDAASEAVPGLKLDLYPHQVTELDFFGLAWRECAIGHMHALYDIAGLVSAVCSITLRA